MIHNNNTVYLWLPECRHDTAYINAMFHFFQQSCEGESALAHFTGGIADAQRERPYGPVLQSDASCPPTELLRSRARILTQST